MVIFLTMLRGKITLRIYMYVYMINNKEMRNVGCNFKQQKILFLMLERERFLKYKYII